MKKSTGLYMRIIHRYLGFFLAGIMAMYAISGIIMIFRQTDFLKKEVLVERTIKPNLSAEDVGKELRIRNLKPQKKEGAIIYFQQGQYNVATGVANYSEKKLPFFIEKMEHLHKATTNSPIYWLNIFFGVSLLFFVISAFWMFLPKTSVFKKGLYFSLAGILLTLLLLFI
ncbi:putative iron-regulated membrane protein [Saonia flava]|uniref:Putative iron-regulated membrane protein n=1 Tax=Saonia flava TaxID=523696 RepID=A0A846QTB3_9FLAO|nr:PepSY domain-containing protein [Saonia flava]NJB70200.1 putative iron-regulated membrane protein [Saonia flava]